MNDYRCEFVSDVLPWETDSVFSKTRVDPGDHKRITSCKVYHGEAVIAEGASANCRCDQDDKLIGQKVALSNALENVPDREVRRRVWEHFWNRTKRGRQISGTAA